MTFLPKLPSPGKFLNIGEAAHVSGVSAATLMQWDPSGRLKPVRHFINGYRLYRRTGLDALLARLVSGEQGDVMREAA